MIIVDGKRMSQGDDGVAGSAGLLCTGRANRIPAVNDLRKHDSEITRLPANQIRPSGLDNSGNEDAMERRGELALITRRWTAKGATSFFFCETGREVIALGNLEGL